jgi:hypothetical protein
MVADHADSRGIVQKFEERPEHAAGGGMFRIRPQDLKASLAREVESIVRDKHPDLRKERIGGCRAARQ